MKIKITLILTIIFFSSYSFSQTNNFKKENAKLLKDLENSAGAEKVSVLYELAELELDNDRKKTFEYLDQAIKISKKTEISDDLEADIYNTYGASYYYENDFGNAIKYYKKELSILEKQSDKKTISEAEYNIATIYLKNQNIRKAKNFFEKSLKDAQEINNQDLMMLNYNSLYKIAHYQNNDSDAYKYFMQYIQLRDEKLFKETTEQTSILRKKYKVERTKREETENILEIVETEKDSLVIDTTKKAQKITLLEIERLYQQEKFEWQKKESEFNKNLAKKRERIIFLISAIGIIMLVVSIILYRMYQQIKSKNKLLTLQKEKIEKQRDRIQIQKHDIERKTKHITASINYASYIQTAMLPPYSEVKKSVGDMFVLFKPRDIVSGDYYWIKQKGDFQVIIAADSTGHGVPGAFMSMLGISIINRLVDNQTNMPANEILNKMRHEVITSLYQKNDDSKSKDGFDLSMIIYKKKTNKIEFSGANNPLILVRNKNEDFSQFDKNKKIRELEEDNNSSKLIEIKGDKMPIGVHVYDNRSFNNFVFDAKKGDCMYLFSDGYQDQFGGEKGTKFMVKNLKKLFLNIHQKSADEQKNILETKLNQWMKAGTGYSQIDDILIVGLKI